MTHTRSIRAGRTWRAIRSRAAAPPPLALAAAAAVGLGCALVAGFLAAGPAGAGVPRGGQGGAAPAESISEILSGIEFVPNRSALDVLMGDGAHDELIAIARGRDGDLDDAGLRIRAYRALGLYPSTDSEAALRTAVAEHGAVSRGVDTLFVRAAMDSLARVAPEASVADLAPMLQHPSQDVRAGAARALGATGAGAAEPVLRARLFEEPVMQVRLAIAEALRKLAEGTEGTVDSIDSARRVAPGFQPR
jgi:hypothetical protein